MRAEIYVSVDVETNGPTPGVHSMLSLGAAAFTRGSRAPMSVFEVNLEQATDNEDPDTMAWWHEQPEAWAHCRKDPEPIRPAVARLDKWVRALPGKPILATWPTWDIAWVTHYFGHYGPGENPFRISALDIKSYAMARLGRPTFAETAKRNFPDWVFAGCPLHTHKALEDAIGQGIMLMNLLEGKP